LLLLVIIVVSRKRKKKVQLSHGSFSARKLTQRGLPQSYHLPSSHVKRENAGRCPNSAAAAIDMARGYRQYLSMLFSRTISNAS
jgi:hypothetical protein